MGERRGEEEEGRDLTEEEGVLEIKLRRSRENRKSWNHKNKRRKRGKGRNKDRENRKKNIKIGGREEGEDIRKILFWNVAEIFNKDLEFWKFIRGFDLVSLSETWVEKKDEERLAENLPKEFRWEMIAAVKVHKKGRAKGGMLIGLRKEWIKEKEIKNDPIYNGLVRTEIKGEKEELRIWSVYNDGNLEKILEELGKEEYTEEKRTIIGGDFNVRIGEGGRLIDNDGEIRGTRCSKDKVKGNGSGELLELVETRGWKILNGNSEGDWEGEFTFIGKRGSSSN